MKLSTVAGIGLLGVAGYMVLGGVNGEGGLGGSGGFGEAIEDAVETPGLTVNIPDYTDLIKSLTTPSIPEVPEVATKKDYVETSFGLLSPYAIPMTPPSMSEGFKLPLPADISTYTYVPAWTPKKAVSEPKTRFLGGLFGGPYHFTPKTGEKSFWTAKPKTATPTITKKEFVSQHESFVSMVRARNA